MEELHPRLKEALEHICCNCGSSFKHVQHNGVNYWKCTKRECPGDGHIVFGHHEFIRAVNNARKNKNVLARVERVCKLMKWEVKKIKTLFDDKIFEIIKDVY